MMYIRAYNNGSYSFPQYVKPYEDIIIKDLIEIIAVWKVKEKKRKLYYKEIEHKSWTLDIK